MLDRNKIDYAIYDRAYQHQRLGWDAEVRRLYVLKDMDGPTGFNGGVTICAYTLDLPEGTTEQDFVDYLYDHYDFFAYYTQSEGKIRFFACTKEQMETGEFRRPVPFTFKHIHYYCNNEYIDHGRFNYDEGEPEIGEVIHPFNNLTGPVNWKVLEKKWQISSPKVHILRIDFERLPPYSLSEVLK